MTAFHDHFTTFPEENKRCSSDTGLSICQADIDRGLTDEQITWLITHLNFTPLLEVLYRPVPSDGQAKGETA